jgi:hypothetical protein
VIVDGSATSSIAGPTYRNDEVYESAPHACVHGEARRGVCSMKGCGLPQGRSDARRSYIEELEPGRFDWDRGKRYGMAFPLMSSTVEVEGVTRGTSVDIVRLLYYLPVLHPPLHPLR